MKVCERENIYTGWKQLFWFRRLLWGNRQVVNKKFKLKTGHNLAAFNDLLRGGFHVHEYNEPITIRWTKYSKSKKDLGAETILKLLEIMLDCDNTDHDVKVELMGWIPTEQFADMND